MDAEKSLDLPSASWGTRRARGITQSESKVGIRNSSVQGQEKMAGEAQAHSQPCLPLPVCSTQTLSGLGHASPPHTGKKNLLSVSQVVKNPLAKVGDARDVGAIPGSGRSPGVGNGNPLQDSCLENSMDRGAW